MSESNSGSGSPEAVLRAVLQEAGAGGTLARALAFAGLDRLPETRELLFKFVDGPLEEALVGLLHPTTAAHLLATIREQLAGIDRSGTRVRSDSGESVGAPTMPPPADSVAAHEYSDLVTGAVHSRITPSWGTRVADGTAQIGEKVWVIVSNDPDLARNAMASAPVEVDVVVASSLAVLKGALARAGGTGSAVVVDAREPPISMDRTIAALTADALNVRVILWRMPTEGRARLLEAIPHARTWLPCDDEVTPAEILQLLGL